MAGRRNCGSKHAARHRHAGSHADQRQVEEKVTVRMRGRQSTREQGKKRGW